MALRIARLVLICLSLPRAHLIYAGLFVLSTIAPEFEAHAQSAQSRVHLGTEPPSISGKNACPTRYVGTSPDRTDGYRSSFAWPMSLDVTPGQPVVSTCYTLSGIAGLKTIQGSRDGMQLSVNGGAFTDAAQRISEGDQVMAKLIAPGKPDAAAVGYATFDGERYLGKFSVRTANKGRAPTIWRVGPNQKYTDLSLVIGQLSAGDVVEVEPGIYAPVEFKRSGTVDAPITIRGVGATRPKIKGSQNGKIDERVVSFTNSNNVIFENFEIEGGSEICVRTMAHNLTLRNLFIHDCQKHGILGADLESGTLIVDRVELTKINQVQLDGKHVIYVATDRDAFPGSIFRVQHSYLHDNFGTSIKSRSERTELFYNWIDAINSPRAFYSVELFGFEEYQTLEPLNSDVVGNVLIHRGIYGMRFGGDGTGASKGHVRVANNTILVGDEFEKSYVIRLFHELDSVYLVNNAILRMGVSRKPLTLFRDGLSKEGKWSSGVIKLAGNNNFFPPGLSLSPATSSDWTANAVGDEPSVSSTGEPLDLSKLRSSQNLLNKGAPLSKMPSGYAIPKPVVNLEFFPPTIAPLTGGKLPLYPRKTQSEKQNIGAF